MKTNRNYLPEEGERHDMFDALAIFEVLRRRIWVVAICALAGMFLAAVKVATSGEVFEATATVQVQEENPAVVAIQDVTKEDFRTPEDLKTVEQQLVASSLMWRVIQANKLDQIPGYFRPGLLHRIQGRPVSQRDMINAISAKFKVKQNRGTRLIDIAVKDENPKMAQTLARSLIDEYISQNIEWRASPSKEASKFLVDEAERLKQKVERSEQAFQEYREKNQAVSLEDKQNIVVERLKDLNIRVAQAQNDTIALESDLAQLEKIGRQPGKLLAIGSIANALSVLDAQRTATTKEGAFAMIRQRYGPENPAYAQADREVQQVRAALDAAVLNAADSLRAKYEAAKVTQLNSEKRLQEQEQLALDLNRKATEYGALNREVQADRALFESVMKRLKETGIIQNINQVPIRIVNPPMLPDAPGLRSKLLFVAIGMFGGGVMGFGLVLGRFVARPCIQSPSHASRVLGIPALGLIPRMTQIKDASQIPGIAEPRSRTAEAFRFVATSVSPILGAEGKGSLLLTSTASGDGAAACAAAYAVAVARSGVRTLLVDADLRNPVIGALFSIPKNAGGLADCLAGRSTLEVAVQPTKVENLFVLVAGSVPPDISGLFSGPAFGEHLGKAAGEYGQVVIASAPVNMASETLLIARNVNAACIVVQNGRTSVSAASRACELLEGTGRPPAGFILCRVPRRMIV